MFIDLFSQQIVCFQCNSEVHNEILIPGKGKNLSFLQAAVKQYTIELILKQDSIEV